MMVGFSTYQVSWPEKIVWQLKQVKENQFILKIWAF